MLRAGVSPFDSEKSEEGKTKKIKEVEKKGNIVVECQHFKAKMSRQEILEKFRNSNTPINDLTEKIIIQTEILDSNHSVDRTLYEQSQSLNLENSETKNAL